jgi:polyferredoxin
MDANTHSDAPPSWLGRTLMAVGISGAAFAALCCVAPFIVAGLVTALGLGFMLNDALLMGLLVVFIAVAALGYYLVRRQTCA